MAPMTWAVLALLVLLCIAMLALLWALDHAADDPYRASRRRIREMKRGRLVIDLRAKR